jgi:hypothetical protein
LWLPGRELGIVETNYLERAATAWVADQPSNGKPSQKWSNYDRHHGGMVAFIGRLLIHHGIYRRYPLARVPALKNAWRIARA